jgi:hypothetical protein
VQPAGRLLMPRVGTLFAVSAQDVAEAVVRAVDRDKAQIVVMPGSGSLSKAMLDLFPAIGPTLNRALGITKLIYRGSELLKQNRLNGEDLGPQTQA